jgi:hypothetical protein
MPERVPVKLADGTAVGSAVVVAKDGDFRIEAEIDDPGIRDALSAGVGDFSFAEPPPEMDEASLASASDELRRCLDP